MTETVSKPYQLNRFDLQAIFEYLSNNTALPPALRLHWVKKHFTVHRDRLHKIVTYVRVPGDPPHPEGLALQSTALLEVPEFEDLLKQARRIHKEHGHATVGVCMREAAYQYWHPELALAAQQACVECPQCQLMKKPDSALPDLQPTVPPQPLTRWAIDFTAFNDIPILVAVEYATGWVEVDVTTDMTFASTLPLLNRICHRFGAPREWISDNASCFKGREAQAYHAKHGSQVFNITPSRPRGNGKVEKMNGLLKAIMTREFAANRQRSTVNLAARAIILLNRTPRTTGYSSFFLMYGTSPPQVRTAATASGFAAYKRDPTDKEEDAQKKDLAQTHEASSARQRANSFTASRDGVRALLQEKKALLRTYAPGDWVLRVRQRAHKHEPFYDGPWAVTACSPGNTYSLRSPGGIPLKTKYNGTNLFPAYAADGHLIRSLWYASRTMLERDRKRLADLVRLYDLVCRQGLMIADDHAEEGE